MDSPKETVVDKFLEGTKASLGALPGGSMVTFLLDQIIRPPILKRTQEWMRQVSELLNAHDIKINDLSSNERFITTFIQASQIAARNHQEEKLVALRNAVINSIETPSYSESLQIHFLHLIDRFTEWHIRVIRIFRDRNWLTEGGIKEFGSGKEVTMRVIEKQYPYLNDHRHRQFTELILSDLREARLIYTEWDSATSVAIERSASTPTLTSIGIDFLEFINKK